ncbi:putative conserved tandem protein 10, partial [Amphidinium carterae]
PFGLNRVRSNLESVSMMVKLLASLALVALLQVSHALSFDVAAAKERPVSKVIALLKDMQKQLEKEQEEDEEIYEKLACWCETNDKEKTKSIAEAEARITDLTSKIEELTGLSAELSTEIKAGEQERAANQAALEKATALRQKQLAEFNAEEKDLLESISALKAAITVLSKHHSTSLLQVPRAHLLGVAATLGHEMQKHSSLLQGVLTPSERRAVGAFIQQPEDYFNAQPTFKQSYAPQSGEIFGILRQMLETFEANLSDSQKEELANQKAYEELKAAKEAQIAAGTAQIDKKTQELATTDEKNAQAKVDVEDTKNSLSADEQFLMMLKEKCAMTDKEWEERQKTRQLEMEAVSKALAVLSSDDAHDLFTRTFNPSLVQTESAAHSERRSRASKLLASVAKKFNNPRLSTLATQVKLDAFTKVKQAIDDMIAALLKEKAEEIKHRDFCISNFNENQLETEKKTREKEDLTALIEDLEMTIKQLTEAIDTLKAEVAEMQVQLKRAGEDREKENKEFQTTVADQRETQKLLTAALGILKEFYAAKGASFAQGKQEPAGPPPPPGFETYKKNEASSGVMGMIQQIVDDAKAMEKDTIRDEEDAQKAYEDFVKETNASIEAKSKNIVNKSEAKAKAEVDHVKATQDKEGVMLELEQLSNYNAQLHTSCDFVLKNFDIRQTARDEEVEALKQAKAILSGAKFEEFLQA